MDAWVSSMTNAEADRRPGSSAVIRTRRVWWAASASDDALAKTTARNSCTAASLVRPVPAALIPLVIRPPRPIMFDRLSTSVAKHNRKRANPP